MSVELAARMTIESLEQRWMLSGYSGTPYLGTPPVLPGQVEVENFDNGGQGLAYYTPSAAYGGWYRPNEGISLTPTSDAGGGYELAGNYPGEWLNYTVNVQQTGTYDLNVRVAADGSGGSFHLLDQRGINLTGELNVPNTGGWTTYQNVSKDGLHLTSGVQQLTLMLDAVGSNGWIGKFNFFTMSLDASSPAPTPLYWDPSGDSPADGGSGTWDISTADWRSGSATGPLVAWNNGGDVNGPYEAVFPRFGGTITLAQPTTASALSFLSDVYDINGGSGSYNLTIAGNQPAIITSSATTANISTPLSAPSGLAKSGSGTLNLTNTVTGSARSLDVQAGTLISAGTESWWSAEVEASGTLDVLIGGVFDTTASINVDGIMQHQGGSIQATSLTIDQGGSFFDSSSSMSGPAGGLTINNSGLFDSLNDQSLNGSAGTFNNSGIYEADNISGSRTTTIAMSFNQGTGGINVASGTLSIPAFTSLSYRDTFTLTGGGVLVVPNLDDYGSTFIQNSATLDISGWLTVGDRFSTDAQYYLNGGTLNCGALGVGGFSTATLYLAGGTLTTGHTEVGSFGNGTIDQTAGVATYNDMYLGYNGNGYENISGGTSTVASLNVGLNGNGTLNLFGNGTLNCPGFEIFDQSGGVGIGNQSGSSVNNVGGFIVGNFDAQGSTYTLAGGTLNAGYEDIGDTESPQPSIGTFIQTGGTNNVYYSISLGSHAGAVGWYDLAGGNINVAGLAIGNYGGAGNFIQSGGSVNDTSTLLTADTTSGSTLNVSGGSMSIAGNAYIGYQAGPVTFIQSGGSVTVGGDLVLSGDEWATDSAGTGTYQLSGTGQLTTGRTFIGYNGIGSFVQTGGADTTQDLVLNGPAGGIGTYNQSGGTLSAANTINVVQPSVSGAAFVNEGSLYTLNLSATTSDVTPNPVLYWNINWGDGTNDYTPYDVTSYQHQYFSGGNTYTINSNAYDNHYWYTIFKAPPVTVVVNDVPATISPIANKVTVAGSPISFVSTFTDPGIHETHVVTIAWGDGSTSQGTVTESNGSGVISGSHTYQSAGNYTPQVMVTDSGGAVGTQTFSADVVSSSPVVTSLSDLPADNRSTNPNDLTLRHALLILENAGGNHTITFASSLFPNNSPETINLYGNSLGDWNLSGVITIQGPATNRLTINGGNKSSDFSVSYGATLNLINLNIQGGNAGAGGGVYNSGTLTVQDCTLSGDTAVYSGGAIYNSGNLVVEDSTITGDTSAGNGGGIYNYGSLLVANSTLTGNSATGDGGAIYNYAGSGIEVTDSTIDGNSAASGGGIFNNSTTQTIDGSIVADSTAGGDLSGSFTGSNNLISDSSFSQLTGSNNLQASPHLSALGFYGGPTQTMALLPGSPAIGAGATFNIAGSALTTDQRGQPIDTTFGGPDIGAFQANALTFNTFSGDPVALGQMTFADAARLATAIGGSSQIGFTLPPTGNASTAPGSFSFAVNQSTGQIFVTATAANGNSQYDLRWFNGNLELYDGIAAPWSDSQPGNPTLSIPCADLSGISILGGTGNNVLAIDYGNVASAGTYSPFGMQGLSFDGGSPTTPGGSQLILTGNAGTSSVNVSNGTGSVPSGVQYTLSPAGGIAYSPAAISFTNAALNIIDSAGNESIGIDNSQNQWATPATGPINITYAPGITVAQNATTTLNVGLGVELAFLNISSGGVATLPVGTGQTLIVDSLSIASSSGTWLGTLDLANNDMVVRNGNLSQITSMLASGWNIGTTNPALVWSGKGINAAGATSSILDAIGAIQNNDGTNNPVYTNFGGVPTSISDVLIKFTLYGDANLDGVVNAADYALLDNGFTKQLTGWYNGDFNYDGVVNGTDYTLADNARNTQSGPSFPTKLGIGTPGTLTLPFSGPGEIDWGDGSPIVQISSSASRTQTYMYWEAGSFAIRVVSTPTGGSPRYYPSIGTTVVVLAGSPSRPAFVEQVQPNSPNEIDFLWSDSSPGTVSYTILRSSNVDGPFVPIGSTAGTRFSVTGVSETDNSSYAIVATNSAGNSIPYVENAQPMPNSPSDLTGTFVNSNEITLTWTNNSSLPVVYSVLQSVDGVNWSAGNYGYLSKITTSGNTVTDQLYCDLSSGSYFEVTAQSVLESYLNSEIFSLPSNAWNLYSTSLPAAPSGVVATAVSDRQMNISWNESSANVTGFSIWRTYANNFSAYFQMATVPDATARTYHDLTTSENCSYQYKVVALSGSQPAASNAAYAVSLPTAPAALSATLASSTEVDLSWLCQSTSPATYYIYESTDGVTWPAIGINAGIYVGGTAYGGVWGSFKLVGSFVSGLPYFFRVVAVNDVTGASSQPAAAAIPAAPNNLNVKSASTSAVTLQWNDTNYNNLTYLIYVATVNTFDPTNHAIATQNTSGYTLSLNSTPGATYYFWVCSTTTSTAYYTGVLSPPAETTVTFPSPSPKALSSISVNFATPSELGLQWIDKNNNIGYMIYVSTVNTFEPTDAIASFYTQNTSGYTVPMTLAPGTTYYFWACSTTATTASSFGVQSTPVETSFTVPPSNPQPPSNLALISATPSTVGLQWVDTNANELAYMIYVSTTNNFNPATAIGAFYTQNTSGYTVSMPFTAGTTYYFWVCSTTTPSAGASGLLSQPSTCLLAPPVAPAPPQGLTASIASASTFAQAAVNLQWTNGPSTENGFIISDSVDAGTTWMTVGSAAANAEHFTIVNLNPATYVFNVVAFNETATSTPATTSETIPSISPNIYGTGIPGNQDPGSGGYYDKYWFYDGGNAFIDNSAYLRGGDAPSLALSGQNVSNGSSYTYYTTFDVSQGYPNISNLGLSGSYSADNYVDAIALDGVSGTVPVRPPGQEIEEGIAFNFPSGIIHTGSNTLSLTLYNDYPTQPNGDSWATLIVSVALTNVSPPIPSVSVSATQPYSVIDDSTHVTTPGQFTFTRSVASPSPLTIQFSVSGIPNPQSDYQLSSGSASYGGLESVTIPANASSATVTLTPNESFTGQAAAYVSIWGSSSSSNTYAIASQAADTAGVELTHLISGGNIAIDSLNISDGPPPVTGALFTAEQLIADNPAKPGKIIVTDTNDGTGGGMPDFIAGVQNTVGQNANVNSGQTFVPMILILPQNANPAETEISLGYDGSDPTLVTGPSASDGGYTLPAQGHLRIWDKGADVTRNGLGLVDGGDYITPGAPFNASLLQWTPNPNNNNQDQTTVYVEAVKPSAQLGDQEIVFNANFNESAGSSTHLAKVGAVRVTSFQDSAPDYASGGNLLDQTATNSDAQDPGAAAYQGDVRLSDGAVQHSVTDFQTNGDGLPWGDTRTWSSQPLVSQIGSALGTGWTMTDWPHLIQGTSTIIAVVGGNVLYFDRGPTGSYTVRYYATEKLVKATDGSYTLTDSVGDVFKFNSFNASANTSTGVNQPFMLGGLSSYTDANGVTATVTGWDSLGNITSITRSSDTFTYNYSAGQSTNTEQLSEIIVQRSGLSTPVAQINYNYSNASSNRSAGNLQLVVVQTISQGALTVTGGSYYAYGANDQLTYAVEGKDFLLLRAAVGGLASSLVNVSTTLVSEFATVAFTYDGLGRAASQAIQGAGDTTVSSATPMVNAVGTYGYSYNSTLGNQPYGINDWMDKTTVTRPDGNKELVYSNDAGEVLLTDLQTTPSYVTFNSYDSQGRLTMTALPSATTPVENGNYSSGSLDSTPDLLNNNGSGTYQGLASNSGLVDYFDYYPSGGAAAGYLKDTAISQGDSGNKIYQSCYTYSQPIAAVGVTLYPVTSVSTFSADATSTTDPSARITSYNYSYGGSTGAELLSVITQLPEVPTSQNGTGTVISTTQMYDAYGNLAETIDGSGYHTLDVYDPATGALTSMTDGDGDVTTYTVDAYGRPTQVTDPNNNITTISYTDGLNSSSTRTTPALGPTVVVLKDWLAGCTETYSVPNGTSGSGAALLSLSVTYFDTGGRTISTRAYYDLTGLTEASITPGVVPGTSYYTTNDGYDSMGRLNKTTDALGTVTKTDYTPMGWVSNVSIGSTVITQNVYDNGNSGDGDLTQSTSHPYYNQPDQVNTNYYDWKDQLEASSNGIGLTYSTLDNLGEVTSTAIYDANPALSSVSDSNGVVSVTSSTGERAFTTYNYDALGQLYRTTEDSVNQATGSTTGPTLATNMYYDARGNVVETDAPGGLVTYTQYDGAGSVILTDTGAIGHGGMSAPSDLVTSVTTGYDNNSNATLVTTTSYTNGTAVRTDSVANWYDAANRLIASADCGTNTPPTSMPTSSSSTALVTTYTYGQDGFLQSSNDSTGTETWQQNDALGRPVLTVQNGTSNASFGTNVLTTSYQYNGDNEVTRQAVINYQPGATSANDTAHIQSQITQYTYGGGSLDKSLLSNISYSADGSASYTYDNLGQVVTMTDRSGDVHTYTYDAAGRQTLDAVTTLGAGIDGTARALGTTYDALGDVLSSTSYSSAAGTGIVNQVSHQYNGFGQVVADYENASGAAPTSSTPSVQYAYDQSNNDSRLSGEVYPDGRVVAYGYGGSTIDNLISRVDQTSEGTFTGSGSSLVITATTNEETDTYLGDSMVIGRALPAINVAETTSLNSLDQVSGLDWVQTRTGGAVDLDQYQYVYDNDGRVKVRTDAGGNSNTDPSKVENFGYSSLGDLTTFAIAGGASVQYTLDSMGNRLGSTTYNSNNEASHANASGGNTTNLVLGGGADAILTYNAWGRLSKVSELMGMGASTIATAISFSYDALGRQLSATTLGSVGAVGDGEGGGTQTDNVRNFAYDAFNNLVQENDTGTTTSGQTTTTLPAVEYQYVWSAGDGRLILRDTVGSKRVYALTDAQGDITSLVDYATLSGQSGPTWQVAERYTYNADGVTSAYDVNWNAIAPSSQTAATIGNYGWTILWRGQQRLGLYDNYSLFASASGSGWYDPQLARTLSPAPEDTGNGGTRYTDEQLTNGMGDKWTSAGWWSNYLDALPGAIEQSAEARFAAIGGAIQQFGYTLADLGNDLQYDWSFASSYIENWGDMTQTSGEAYYNGHLSAVEQAIDSGTADPLSWSYAGKSLYGAGNAMTFGILDEGVASVQWGLGSISADQWGNRVAVAGAGQLLAAATIPAGANIGLSTDIECMVMQARVGAADICFVPGTQILVEDLQQNESGWDDDRGTESDLSIAGTARQSAAGTAFASLAAYRTRNIEHLIVGEVVLTRDQYNPFGNLIPSRVAAIFRRTVYDISVLAFRDSKGTVQEIRCTDNHPFWLVGTGWVEAERLAAGQEVLQADGSTATVVGSQREHQPNGIVVCNFEVEGMHTYFVSTGDNAVPLWVHNACVVRFTQGAAGTNPLVDAVGYEIRSAVDQAEGILQSGGTGGTTWGRIYQNLPAGHWLEDLAYGSAVQQIADTFLRGNSVIQQANVVFNKGSMLGLTNGAGNLLIPDYQLPLGVGNWATFDITTLGQAGKIGKYGSPSSPYLVNLLY